MPKWKETYVLEQQAKELLGWHLLTAERPARPLVRARVVVTFVHPLQRARDTDNSMGQAKPLIDALKGSFLQDDSADHLELIVKNRVVPTVTETRISIEEMS